MEYINLTKADFEKYTPSAIDAQNFIFDELTGYFQNAYVQLSNHLLGRKFAIELVNLLNSLNSEEPIKEEILSGFYVDGKSLSEIEELVKKYVIMHGFKTAIPQLDLILTNNGFGIVNTEHVAPASKDRVDRLIKECERECDDAFEQLLFALPGNSLTREQILESTSFRLRTDSIVWSSEMLYKIAQPKNEYSYSDLTQMRNIIARAEFKIKCRISLAQWRDTMNFLRDVDNMGDEEYAHLVGLLFDWLRELMFNDNPAAIGEAEGLVLTYLDANEEKFESWAKSDEYKAKHFETYKNGIKDRSFFF